MATRANGGRPGRDTNGGPPVRAKLDSHPARVAWLIAAGLDHGHGRDRLRRRRRQRWRWRGASERRQGRGRAEPDRLGRLRRGRLDDPKVDWVPTSRSRPAARSSVKVAGTSDEMVQLMRTGQYDGVSASGNAIGAPGRRRRRRPGQRRPGPELRDGLRRPQGPAVQHLRRRPTTGSRTGAGRTC